MLVLDADLAGAAAILGTGRLAEVAPSVFVLVLAGDAPCPTPGAAAGVAALLPARGLDAPALRRALDRALDHRRLLVALDVARREARQREADFRNLIANGFEGVVVLDESGVIACHNRAARQLFDDDPARLRATIARLPIVVGHTVEVSAPSERRPARLLEVRAMHVRFEGEPATLVLLRDASDRVRAQELVERVAQAKVRAARLSSAAASAAEQVNLAAATLLSSLATVREATARLHEAFAILRTFAAHDREPARRAAAMVLLDDCSKVLASAAAAVAKSGEGIRSIRAAAAALSAPIEASVGSGVCSPI